MAWKEVSMDRKCGGGLPSKIQIDCSENGTTKIRIPKFIKTQFGDKCIVKVDNDKALFGLFPYDVEKELEKKTKSKPLSLKSGTVSFTSAIQQSNKINPLAGNSYEFPLEYDEKNNCFIIDIKGGKIKRN